MSTELEFLFERLRSLRAAWMSRGWSWDRRFDCAASTFMNAEIERAHGLVSEVLSQEWNDANLVQAPPLIVELAEATGGLRSDQIIFASPSTHVVAYGLWWPWGGESSSVSLRVGLTGDVTSGDMAKLRQLFGATDD